MEGMHTHRAPVVLHSVRELTPQDGMMANTRTEDRAVHHSLHLHGHSICVLTVRPYHREPRESITIDT
jgi:hypothetical protein